MKIVLATTMVDAPEAVRIGEEIKKLGHELEMYDARQFEIEISDGNLNVPGLTDRNPDVVIVRGILRHLKPIASLVKRLRNQGVKVFDNNFLMHKYSISKVTDLIKLSMSGIPVPDTYYVGSWDEFPAACAKVGYPAVIKSVRSGQGARVFKVDSEKELEDLIKQAQVDEKKSKNYIIQKFFDYKLDLRVLVIGQKMYAMQRIPREGDFRANFSLGGSVVKHDLTEAERELALKAMDAVEMSVAGVDILVGKDGSMVILEVNHTAGMKGMESATGENITKVYVEHAIASAK